MDKINNKIMIDWILGSINLNHILEGDGSYPYVGYDAFWIQYAADIRKSKKTQEATND